AALSATVFTVTATDTVGASANATFTLAINGPIAANLDIASKAITAGTAASFKPVSGAGGTVPYVYTIAPALPSSLSIDSTTGTTSFASASATITVTVSDSVGATASNGFSLTINVPLVANSGTISSRTFTAGSLAATFTPLPLTGGTPAYAWSVAPALPAGLT